jgi:hypothetical protein
MKSTFNSLVSMIPCADKQLMLSALYDKATTVQKLELIVSLEDFLEIDKQNIVKNFLNQSR